MGNKSFIGKENRASVLRICHSSKNNQRSVAIPKNILAFGTKLSDDSIQIRKSPSFKKLDKIKRACSGKLLGDPAMVKNRKMLVVQSLEASKISNNTDLMLLQNVQAVANSQKIKLSSMHN